MLLMTDPVEEPEIAAFLVSGTPEGPVQLAGGGAALCWNEGISCWAVKMTALVVANLPLPIEGVERACQSGTNPPKTASIPACRWRQLI